MSWCFARACGVSFFILIVFLYSVECRFNFEKDSIYPGGLVLPQLWNGDVSSFCYFPALSRSPSKFYLVRNRLYSLVPPGKSSSYPYSFLPGEVHFRPTDSVFPDKCPPTTSERRSTNFITFKETNYSFAVSPQDDVSVLTTLDIDSAILKLAIIDSKDLFVSYKTFPLDSEVLNNLLSVRSLVKVSTTFLSARYMLIELSTRHRYESKLDTVIGQFSYDKTTDQVVQLSKLPFSIFDDRRYVIDLQSSDAIHVITYHDLYVRSTRTYANVTSYRSPATVALNFTTQWNFTFWYDNQNSLTPTYPQLMYHSALHQVILSAFDLFCLNATTGNIIHTEDFFPTDGHLVGNTKQSFFIRQPSIMTEIIYNRNNSTWTRREMRVSYITSLVSQSGDVFSIGRSSYYSKLYAYALREDRKQIILGLDMGYNCKLDMGIDVMVPTNHFLLLTYADGGYSLFTPLAAPPTPAPTPRPTYVPTPYRYPTPAPTPYRYPTPPPTPYRYPTPPPTPYRYPTPYYWPTPPPTPYRYPTPNYWPTPHRYPTPYYWPTPYRYQNYWDANLWFRIFIFSLSAVAAIIVIAVLVTRITMWLRQRNDRYHPLTVHPGYDAAIQMTPTGAAPSEPPAYMAVHTPNEHNHDTFYPPNPPPPAPVVIEYPTTPVVNEYPPEPSTEEPVKGEEKRGE